MRDGARRRLRVRGHEGGGPAATAQATPRALARIADSRAIVLVEGISDQIALETLAARRGCALDAERVVILPIGGVQAIARHLTALGAKGAQVTLAGLCDAAGEEVFRRALAMAHLGWPRTRDEMERLGFFVCVDDLESELIRAVGTAKVEALFDSQGDLGSFRTLQKQSPWRAQSVEDQMRRFLGSGAHRKLRYARLLVAAVELDRVPRPLDAVLAHVSGDSVVG